MNLELFITCASGLEPLLADELQKLGCDRAIQGYRGVAASGCDIEAVYRINYNSRFGSRVLLPLSRFRCYNRDTLYNGAASVDWSKYFAWNQTFAIDANVNHPRLRNSLFAAQVVKDAICDQLIKTKGERPSIDVKNPDIQLNLFVDKERGVLSFDTSGSPLHKRGYRDQSVEAPLQESLAAALLQLANYTGAEILYDPCCGSGTLLIEAALIATHTPPGYLREIWGFMQLPQYSEELWNKVKAESNQNRQPLAKGKIFGTDINAAAVRACKSNLRTAGFHQEIEVVQYDFRQYEPTVLPNMIISNPPHGKRLGDEEELKELYRSLGDLMKHKATKPGRGFIFTGSLELAKEVGLAAKRRHVISNSGIDSRLLEFNLY